MKEGVSFLYYEGGNELFDSFGIKCFWIVNNFKNFVLRFF